MSNSEIVTLEHLIERSKKKVEFSIETSQEGKLEFDMFRAWREEALYNNVKDIETLDAEIFAKILMKYLLSRYKNIVIDIDSYNNNKSIFNNINLQVNKEELIEFAEKFLDHNTVLLYKPYSEEVSKYEQDPDAFKERAEKNKEPYFDFPEDTLEKLRQAFILNNKRQLEFAKNILGLNIPKNFSSKVNLINQHNKMDEIFKLNKSFSPIVETIRQQNSLKEKFKPVNISSELKKTKLSNSSFKHEPSDNPTDILDKEVQNRVKINTSIIRTPELLESLIENQASISQNIDFQLNNLIEVQKIISKANNAQIKASNEILQDQFNLAEKNIKSSSITAYIAMFISILSIFVSGIIGWLQLSDSNETSLKTFNKYDTIIDSITDGNKAHKKEIDTTNKLIETLIEENEKLKNKVNTLENQINQEENN